VSLIKFGLSLSYSYPLSNTITMNSNLKATDTFLQQIAQGEMSDYFTYLENN